MTGEAMRCGHPVWHTGWLCAESHRMVLLYSADLPDCASAAVLLQHAARRVGREHSE
jgi:hypothetical protein